MFYLSETTQNKYDNINIFRKTHFFQTLSIFGLFYLMFQIIHIADRLLYKNIKNINLYNCKKNNIRLSSKMYINSHIHCMSKYFFNKEQAVNYSRKAHTNKNLIHTKFLNSIPVLFINTSDSWSKHTQKLCDLTHRIISNINEKI